MFSGIVEAMAKVSEIKNNGTNKVFYFESPITGELHENQSVSHNGVCLTVTEVKKKVYSVTAVEETLLKSNLGDLKPGDYVNLERSLSMGYRFDGHIVQGHVDQTGICRNMETLEGSWLFDFEYDFEKQGNFIVEKGSVSVNGVSLTAFNCREGFFRVTIIPYTWEHTNFQYLNPGDRVNLEFDMIGKYIQKMFSQAYQDYLKKKLG
jgi:riboflavin synthase